MAPKKKKHVEQDDHGWARDCAAETAAGSGLSSAASAASCDGRSQKAKISGTSHTSLLAKERAPAFHWMLTYTCR